MTRLGIGVVRKPGVKPRIQIVVQRVAVFRTKIVRHRVLGVALHVVERRGGGAGWTRWPDTSGAGWTTEQQGRDREDFQAVLMGRPNVEGGAKKMAEEWITQEEKTRSVKQLQQQQTQWRLGRGGVGPREQ